MPTSRACAVPPLTGSMVKSCCGRASAWTRNWPLRANTCKRRKTSKNEFADRERERNKAAYATALQITSQSLQIVGDFQKIASDKELVRVDADKKKRLASLDAEYKAGTISKDIYEAQKASIEASLRRKNPRH